MSSFLGEGCGWMMYFHTMRGIMYQIVFQIPCETFRGSQHLTRHDCKILEDWSCYMSCFLEYEAESIDNSVLVDSGYGLKVLVQLWK